MRAKSVMYSLICLLATSGAVWAIEKQNSQPANNLEAQKASYRRPVGTPFPEDNPYSTEKAQLGLMLFFDPRLSGSNNISCATCHNPSLSWGDGMAKGIGHGASVLGRRSPTVANLAWADLLMWDGRKSSLEDQVFGPIEADVEMANSSDKLIARLNTIQDYKSRFRTAFPTEGITKTTIAKAIATFERTVVSGIAPFDRWLAGDEEAISPAAKRGFILFNGKANCSACHEGWSMTDHSFHDIGLPDVDLGRGKNLPLPSMQHAFKTPTLRDIARRSPYMHDGSIATLRDVVLHYDHKFVVRPSLAAEIKPLGLSARDVDDLVALMESFTSDPQPLVLPVLPTSTH
jgi:cytochrome c peroxidase